MTDKEKIIKELETIPWIGNASSARLYEVGVRKISDLKDADPEHIYLKSCAKAGERIDRCWLYVIRCAVYFASTKNPDPNLLQWNFWSDKNMKR